MATEAEETTQATEAATEAPTEAPTDPYACGEKLKWDYADGVLTIFGEGEMDDFSEGAPWAEHKADIKKVVLSGEISYDVECNPLHGPRVQAIIEKLESGLSTPKLTYVEESAFDASILTKEMIDSRGY